MLGWSGGIDFDSRQLWASDQWPTSGGLNLAAYSNPEADRLMNAIIKVYDYDKQVEMSHQIFRTIANDFPYVFLYSPLATTVMDNRIVWRKKVGTNADGSPMYEDRPVNHDFVRNARANLKYFMGELKRVEEAPAWQPEDFKR
jgi:ABC-type transport system substrate-binding protein